jgi:RNA polymerase sigma factor (sigma-70 family)
MPHDADAEDTRLVEQGKIEYLLAKYGDVIVGRCVARLRGHPDAEDVAQNVKLRLLREFHRGKRYVDVPYRVVVHQVIGWTLSEYFDGRPTDVELPEDWSPEAADPAERVEADYYIESLFEDLPPRQRQVLELRYLSGLDHEEIARRLDMTRNAVDQALHNGHARLRRALVHA